jgi:hypothetical protein
MPVIVEILAISFIALPARLVDLTGSLCCWTLTTFVYAFLSAMLAAIGSFKPTENSAKAVVL